MSDRDPNDWLMSDEELDEYLDATERDPDDQGEPPLPPIAAEEQAQGYVRAYAYHHREALSIEARYMREIEHAQAWRDAEMAKLDRRKGWLSGILQAFLWATGAKSIKFPAGTLKRTKGRERVTVEDEATFIETHRGTDLVRIKEEVAKAAIAKHIRNTGEVPEGVEMERAEDIFSIKLEERDDD